MLVTTPSYIVSVTLSDPSLSVSVFCFPDNGILSSMTVTRAMADMESIKHEITEMMKKIEECETSINNCMNTKCDAIEANIKQYINATVCVHINGIFKRLKLLPQNNADKQNMSKSDDKLVVVPTDNPPKNDGSIVGTIDNQPSEAAAPEATTGRLEPSTAAKPVPLESANTRPPKHDVCISGLKKATSNDDVHAHLMDLGVSDIVSISRISDESSVSATFRITINDHSIKHNVYDRNRYKEGIKVIPYRFYKTDKMQPSVNSNNRNHPIKHPQRSKDNRDNSNSSTWQPTRGNHTRSHNRPHSNYNSHVNKTDYDNQQNQMNHVCPPRNTYVVPAIPQHYNPYSPLQYNNTAITSTQTVKA